MPRSPQTYANHRRLFPLFHYVALPILLANVVVSVAHAIRQPAPYTGWMVILSIGLVAGVVASRASSLIVQNRVIALEVRLRLATTLPQELRVRIPELNLRHRQKGQSESKPWCKLLTRDTHAQHT